MLFGLALQRFSLVQIASRLVFRHSLFLVPGCLPGVNGLSVLWFYLLPFVFDLMDRYGNMR